MNKIQRTFPKLTSQVYIEREEVKQYDGYSLVEPLIDKSKVNELAQGIDRGKFQFYLIFTIEIRANRMNWF